MTIQQAKALALEQLASGSSPLLDAEVFLKWILKRDKTFLLFHRDGLLSPAQEQQFRSCIAKRAEGLPVAYITGTKEFFGLEFKVTPDVLIPKPDTEILVENALNFIEGKFRANPCKAVSVCDMCSGSGCVGISILNETERRNIIPKELLPRMTFADISGRTLETARQNANHLLSSRALSRISFVQTNLFESMENTRGGRFDIIVSNPPYIPYAETKELLKDGRNEPELALCGDIGADGTVSGCGDGLEIIRRLASQAQQFLRPQGILILEAGEYNAQKAKDTLDALGFTDTKLFLDLEGQLRNVSGTACAHKGKRTEKRDSCHTG